MIHLFRLALGCCLVGPLASLVSLIPAQASQPLQIAQAACPRAMPLLYYVTATYQISICIGQDGSQFYRGVERANPENSINLFELSETGEHAYLATNGNVSYAISPQQLTVTQNGKVIWQEPVISWSPAEVEQK